MSSYGERAKVCRSIAIDLAEKLGSGHLGGSLSIIDALLMLYNWKKDDDIVVYSKAHCSEAMYAVLYENGIISGDTKLHELPTHCEIGTPGIEYSGGSLGQGLSYAAGVAHALKMKCDITTRVYCILGDGECEEGSVWEAFEYVASQHLDNLTIIIDCNGYGSSEDRKLDQKKLLSKLYAFGLRCKVIDGHNYGELVVMNPFADPGCILLDTVKGKGVPLWEKNHVHLVYGDMLKMGIKEWRDINRVS